jgi:hypothetical protein
MSKATYDDVNLILRLYDMRREEKLRAARAWYVANFKPKTMEEMAAIAGPGTDGNASFRQAISYWDMVAGFVTSGVLNEELFFQSNREIVLFWLRLKPVIEEVRKAYKDPNAWRDLQTVAESYARYVGPEVFEAFAARVS